MYVCTQWLSLTGLLTLGALFAAAEQDEFILGPQNGLIVDAHKKGARIEVSRQLPPPVTPTTTQTPASVNASSPATPVPTSPATPGPVPTTDEILLYFAELREVDADGVQVKQTSGVERSFSSFDTQDFNASLASIPQIPNSQPSVPADTLTLDFALPSPLSGIFKAVIAVTKANGSVNSGDEVMTLTAGQLEVSAEIDAWQWCESDCVGSKPSMFLEMDVVVQLPPGRTVKEADGQSYGRPERFSLGKDAWADFSTKVYVDHSWLNLTSGYPKLSMSDSKNTLTVRLPRFNTSAIYNMVFDPGFQPADTRGTVGGASAVGDVTMVRLFVTVAMAATGFGLFA